MEKNLGKRYTEEFKKMIVELDNSQKSRHEKPKIDESLVWGDRMKKIAIVAFLFISIICYTESIGKLDILDNSQKSRHLKEVKS